MTVAYFDESAPKTEAPVRVAPGFWRRVLARIIEARTRQAEREIAEQYRHLTSTAPHAQPLVQLWHFPAGD